MRYFTLLVIFICLLFSPLYKSVAQVFNGFEVVLANPDEGTLPLGVEQYAIDPSNDSIIFALLGNDFSGYTLDAGLTWTLLPEQSGNHVMFYTSDSLLKVDGQDILLSTDLGTSWNLLHTHTSDLFTLHHAGYGYIYVGGTNGTILLSKDAGVTWQTMFDVTFGFPHVVNLHSLDTINVFAMGGSGGTSARMLRRSTDGFQTSVNISPSGSVNFQNLSIQNRGFMHFFDQDFAIMGFGYRLWRSLDGGNSWSSPMSYPVSNVTGGHFNGLKIEGDSVFIMRSNIITLSPDKMQSFVQLQSGITTAGLQGASSSSTQFIVRDDDVLFTYGNGLIYRYDYSTNTFNHLHAPVMVAIGGANTGIGMVNFRNLDEGVASGPFHTLGNHFNSATWNDFAVSQDGGLSYDFFSHSGNTSITPVRDYYFIDSLNGFVQRAQTVTNLSPVYYTEDGGLTWNTQPTEVIGHPNFVFGGNGGGIHALNMDTVFMATGNTLLRTFNKGSTWDLISLSLPNMVNGIHFWNVNDGILSCPDGVFVTSDGGENWTSTYSGLGRSVKGFGNGAAVIGGWMFALVTSDFGQTFTEIDPNSTAGLGNQFWGSHMLDDDFGVLTSSSRALITFDGWSSHHVVNLPIGSGSARACQMLSDSSVVIGSGNFLLKIRPSYTTPMLEVNKNMNPIICESEQISFSVSDDGFLNIPEFVDVYVFNATDTIIQDIAVPYSASQVFNYSVPSVNLSIVDTVYHVEVFATGTSIKDAFQIVIYPYATAPMISLMNDTLFTVPSQMVEWYLDNNYITGANNSYHVPQSNGVYFAVANPFGACESDPSNEIIINNLSTFDVSLSKLKIHPNPSNGEFVIQTPSGYSGEGYLTIVDGLGKTILHKSIADLEDGRVRLLDVAAGVYTLKLDFNGTAFSSRVVIH